MKVWLLHANLESTAVVLRRGGKDEIDDVEMHVALSQLACPWWGIASRRGGRLPRSPFWVRVARLKILTHVATVARVTAVLVVSVASVFAVLVLPLVFVSLLTLCIASWSVLLLRHAVGLGV